MLPETKLVCRQLKEAGLARSQFRVRTPWKASAQDYGVTVIELTCSFSSIVSRLQVLAKFFKVTVVCLDGMPVHVSLETAVEPGLFRKANGLEERVEKIDIQGDFTQLTLWQKEEGNGLA